MLVENAITRACAKPIPEIVPMLKLHSLLACAFIMSTYNNLLLNAKGRKNLSMFSAMFQIISHLPLFFTEWSGRAIQRNMQRYIPTYYILHNLGQSLSEVAFPSLYTNDFTKCFTKVSFAG